MGEAAVDCCCKLTHAFGICSLSPAVTPPHSSRTRTAGHTAEESCLLFNRQVGKHKVSAMLNDALLPGCPYTISASATEVRTLVLHPSSVRIGLPSLNCFASLKLS